MCTTRSPQLPEQRTGTRDTSVSRVPDMFRYQQYFGPEAGCYGIPEDIIAQTDRATLWALVCTAEVLNASGITDPYELYEHMHPSDVETCIGSGMRV